MMGEQQRTESLFYYFRLEIKFRTITFTDSLISTSISVSSGGG
jgi:hypothetical protein